jgi:multicomponent Na+:H+ antiporter subunit G
MSEAIALALLLLGVGFMVLSAVGVVRMPDVYMRLQVASKASSLGAALLMLGVAVHFMEVGVVVRALLVILFIFLTTPVSAHLIGRAAYMTGVPLWERSGGDELRGAYDPGRGTLRSPEQMAATGERGPVPSAGEEGPGSVGEPRDKPPDALR